MAALEAGVSGRSVSPRESMDTDAVEVDPSGRYVRYKEELLGSGSFKTVYKAFDREEGKEVAWNQFRVGHLSEKERLRLQSEIDILSQVDCKNIIRLEKSWVDPARQSAVFITEMMASGTLKQYIHQAKGVKLKTIKKWCHQILSGLMYLHQHNPPIIHRDLKCENIFIDGHSGEVKIGDLGLSTMLHGSKKLQAKSVVGTPEFMAPEVFDENYTERADIYAFGMCVLEMVTDEYPYSECSTTGQVYRRVSRGIPPRALKWIANPVVREFIEKCIGPAEQRPSAESLLKEPFLNTVSEYDDEPVEIRRDEEPADGAEAAEPEGELELGNDDDSLATPGAQAARAAAAAAAGGAAAAAAMAAAATAAAVPGGPHAPATVVLNPALAAAPPTGTVVAAAGAGAGVAQPPGAQPLRPDHVECASAEREGNDTLRFKLVVTANNDTQQIEFPFNLRSDTPSIVAQEMVRDLGVAQSMCILIERAIAPEVAAALQQQYTAGPAPGVGVAYPGAVPPGMPAGPSSATVPMPPVVVPPVVPVPVVGVPLSVPLPVADPAAAAAAAAAVAAAASAAAAAAATAAPLAPVVLEPAPPVAVPSVPSVAAVPVAVVPAPAPAPAPASVPAMPLSVPAAGSAADAPTSPPAGTRVAQLMTAERPLLQLTPERPAEGPLVPVTPAPASMLAAQTVAAPPDARSLIDATPVRQPTLSELTAALAPSLVGDDTSSLPAAGTTAAAGAAAAASVPSASVAAGGPAAPLASGLTVAVPAAVAPGGLTTPLAAPGVVGAPSSELFTELAAVTLNPIAAGSPTTNTSPVAAAAAAAGAGGAGGATAVAPAAGAPAGNAAVASPSQHDDRSLSGAGESDSHSVGGASVRPDSRPESRAADARSDASSELAAAHVSRGASPTSMEPSSVHSTSSAAVMSYICRDHVEGGGCLSRTTCTLLHPDEATWRSMLDDSALPALTEAMLEERARPAVLGTGGSGEPSAPGGGASHASAPFGGSGGGGSSGGAALPFSLGGGALEAAVNELVVTLRAQPARPSASPSHAASGAVPRRHSVEAAGTDADAVDAVTLQQYITELDEWRRRVMDVIDSLRTEVVRRHDSELRIVTEASMAGQLGPGRRLSLADVRSGAGTSAMSASGSLSGSVSGSASGSGTPVAQPAPLQRAPSGTALGSGAAPPGGSSASGPLAAPVAQRPGPLGAVAASLGAAAAASSSPLPPGATSSTPVQGGPGPASAPVAGAAGSAAATASGAATAAVAAAAASAAGATVSGSVPSAAPQAGAASGTGAAASAPGTAPAVGKPVKAVTGGARMTSPQTVDLDQLMDKYIDGFAKSNDEKPPALERKPTVPTLVTDPLHPPPALSQPAPVMQPRPLHPSMAATPHLPQALAGLALGPSGPPPLGSSLPGSASPRGLTPSQAGGRT